MNNFKKNPETDEIAHKVFYFRPDTFLLEGTDKQRHYREALVRKIGGMPKPEPIAYLGDQLHRAFVSTVAD